MSSLTGALAFAAAAGAAAVMAAAASGRKPAPAPVPAGGAPAAGAAAPMPVRRIAVLPAAAPGEVAIHPVDHLSRRWPDAPTYPR